MKLVKEYFGKVALTIDKDNWSINKDYDRLVLVTNEESSGLCAYISRKPVVAGTSIHNTTYWKKLEITSEHYSEVLNVSEYYKSETGVDYLVPFDITDFIDIAEEGLKQPYKIFTFITDLDTWEIWQFLSDDAENWDDLDYWDCIHRTGIVSEFDEVKEKVKAANSSINVSNLGIKVNISSNGYGTQGIEVVTTPGQYQSTGLKVKLQPGGGLAFNQQGEIYINSAPSSGIQSLELDGTSPIQVSAKTGDSSTNPKKNISINLTKNKATTPANISGLEISTDSGSGASGTTPGLRIKAHNGVKLDSNGLSIKTYDDTLQCDSNGLKVKIYSQGGLGNDGEDGMLIKLPSNSGLQLSSSGLSTKLKSNGGLGVDSNGLYWLHKPQAVNALPTAAEANVGTIYYVPKKKSGYDKTLNGYMYIYEPAIVLAPGDTITVYENGNSSSTGVVAIVKITSSIEYLAYSGTGAPRSATYTNNTSENITVYLASSVGISEAVDYQVIKANGSTEYDIYQLIKDGNNTLRYVSLMADTDDKEDKVAIETPVDTTDPTDPITSLTCEVNKYYRVDVTVDTLAVTLPAMSDLTTVKTVVIYLTAGTTPAVTISAADSKDVYYQDGFEIEAGSTYEINALFNGSAWIVAAVKVVVPEVEEEGGE